MEAVERLPLAIAAIHRDGDAGDVVVRKVMKGDRFRRWIEQ